MKDIRSVQYYLMNKAIGDGMYARVVGRQPYTEKDFIEFMCNNDSEVSPDIIKRVLKNLQKTCVGALQSGIPLTINNFLRIYPSIKGSFKGTDDGFDSSRHSLNFKAVISPIFVKEVLEGLRVEKVKRPKGNAELNRIENVRTNEEELTHHFTNRVFGNFLIFAGYFFSGIEIRNARNKSDSVFIAEKDLNISTYTANELAFTIIYSYELPAWLVDGTDIYLKLCYEAKEEHVEFEEEDYASFSLLTRWKNL